VRGQPLFPAQAVAPLSGSARVQPAPHATGRNHDLPGDPANCMPPGARLKRHTLQGNALQAVKPPIIAVQGNQTGKQRTDVVPQVGEHAIAVAG